MRRNLRPEELGDLLTKGKIAVLATHSADGTMLLTPVWHEWSEGGFSVVIGAGDVKARNLQRDRRASIVVADDTPPYRGIEVRGEAAVGSGDALAALHRIAARYLGPELGRAYADSADPGGLTLIRLLPGVLRAWDFADEMGQR